MATGDVPDPPADDRFESIAHRLVPVGMGVLTWLVALLVVGSLLSVDSLSVMSVVLLIGLALLFLPVYRFRPWEEGLTDRVFGFARLRRLTLAVAVGLFALVRLPVIADLLGPVLGILLLPLRAAPQVLFGVKVFYGARFGDLAGRLVFEAGRLYVEFLWLYTLGTVVEVLTKRGSDRS